VLWWSGEVGAWWGGGWCCEVRVVLRNPSLDVCPSVLPDITHTPPLHSDTRDATRAEQTGYQQRAHNSAQHGGSRGGGE